MTTNSAFTSKVNIRFSDIDLFGHVNNAVYLTYYEEARVAYFNSVIGYDYDWSKEGIILARFEVDFIKPVLFKDEVFIKIKCSRIGTKSFDLSYEMLCMDGEKEFVVSTATSVMVMFNYEEKRSIPVNDEWKKNLLM